MGRKDVGVALVVLLALALGWLLRTQVEGLTQTFEDSTSSFRMAYPATWASIDALQDVLLKVEDPQAPSTFKTTLTVESRELDLASPPTLQALVDRRIAQRETLTGYHLLANNEATVGGARSAQIEYAYVVQPLDTPLRASLPVVVRAREYIVVGSGHVYYLTLAAPENAFAEASQRFDALLQTVQL
jgi:hypothetical protein